MIVIVLVIVPLIWILFGIGAAMAAANKGRSGCGWFLLGVLLGPFGLIFAILARPESKKEETLPHSAILDPMLLLDQETKKCPQCAEIIKLEAKRCRFCGEEFSQNEVAKQILERQAEITEKLRKEGKKQCPICGSWQVHNAYLPDGSFGPWCPICKKPAN